MNNQMTIPKSNLQSTHVLQNTTLLLMLGSGTGTLKKVFIYIFIIILIFVERDREIILKSVERCSLKVKQREPPNTRYEDKVTSKISSELQ